MPHRYLLACSSQVKALHGVVCGQRNARETGHGSAAQQTPQPLQGVPILGLAGASR